MIYAKKKIKALKKLTLFKPPRIFKEKSKINILIYNLLGLIIHRGDASFGHYYSNNKDNKENSWYKYDGKYINKIDIDEFPKLAFGIQDNLYDKNLDNNAYIKFYEKKIIYFVSNMIKLYLSNIFKINKNIIII